MLLYIIDGFNLLHRVPKLKESTAPHNDLITYIQTNKLTGSHNNKVIIVFDGWLPPVFTINRQYRIIFSNELKADEIIIRLASNHKSESQTIIVSDDREIRNAAAKFRVTSLRTYEFIKTRNETNKQDKKEISYSLQKEITDEMRKIWLKE